MSWIGRLFGRKALERDLDRELKFHLDAAIADHVRAGLSRDDAERRARIELGGLEQVKEGARDARGTRWVEDLIGDARYAVRGLVRSKGFSAAAILTLALGIGANTAVWTIVDALMLRSLPVDDPGALYAVRRAGLNDGYYLLSHDRFRRIAQALPDSTSIAAMSEISRMYASIGESPEAIEVQLVSADWFKVLGVRAQLGRVINDQDARQLGGHPVAVLSDGFWRTRYAADPDIVGKTIRVNGLPLTIVGVAAPGFTSLTVGQPIALWTPIVEQHEIKYIGNYSASNSDTDKPWMSQNGIEWLTLVTRADPATVAGAEKRIDAVFRADLETMVADRDTAARAYAMREHLVLESISRGFSPLRQFYRDPLKLLFVSVGLVLLIACGNLAGLLIARGAARSQEMAVRISLGAHPGRLLRQVLTESLTLALLGGVASLFVAKWGSEALLKAASSTGRVPLDTSLGWRSLGFAFGIAIATGVLFGLVPALRVARSDLYETFRAGGRVLGRGSHRLPLGRLLVMSQIAMSLVLVTSAGLLVRTFQNWLSINPGYQPDRVVSARIDIRSAGYSYEQLPGLHQRLLDAVKAIPGVQSASLSVSGIAGNSRRQSGYTIPGRDLPPAERAGQDNFVTPEFFSTVGMTMVAGRPFTDADRMLKDGRNRVAIVSQTAAKQFFGKENVVGERFGYGTPPEFEIVGVVADARVNSIKEQPRRLVFFPLAQVTQEFVTSIEARVSGPTEPVIAGIRKAVIGVDPKLPVREVTTLRSLLERGLTRERLVARLAGAFGVLALLLAGIGLYGVIGYSVSRRTNEMGVRLALGSSPAGVGWLVVRDSLTTIGLGLAAGLALWYPLTRFTEKLVYGVQPHDRLTVAGALTLLVVVGAVAALLPAIRASKVDPLEAIRTE